MSQYMRLRVDPRSGKGVCSDCKHLFVMARNAYGSESAYCARFLEVDNTGPLIPLPKPLVACTKYDRHAVGNFDTRDAWLVQVDEDGTYLSAGTKRFINGQYENRVWKGGHYVWIPAETPEKKKRRFWRKKK